MADWTDIDTDALLPGEPLTSAIALALEENPRAIAEQATGAPKLAAHFVNAQSLPGGAITFSGLGEFGGIIAHITAIRTGASDNVTLAFSSDGSSYSTPVTVGGVNVGADTPFTLFFDFASGDWLTERDDGTIAGSGLDITHVRFDSVDSSISILLNPQGGASA